MEVATKEPRPGPGGDALPGLVSTGVQSVTIAASAAEVWPWLVQIGRGRAGFYTYTCLENTLGADLRNLDVIAPELQVLAPGDRVWLTPDPYLGRVPGQYWVVHSVEPERQLVMVQRLRGTPRPQS